MATNVIMPALEMAQDKGKLLRWLKSEGSPVTQGEPIMEIETDKVTVEIEAPASGALANITAHAGDVIPVGQTIALILAAGESAKSGVVVQSSTTVSKPIEINASPVARKVAEGHGVDLAVVKPGGGRIEKADVLAYLQKTDDGRPETEAFDGSTSAQLIAASPKARRLAQERGVDIFAVRGSGPDGAIIAADVPMSSPNHPIMQSPTRTTDHSLLPTVWRVMAERMSQSWTTAPHFYLTRDVNVSRLVAWRESAQKHSKPKITYTDLLVKVIAAALKEHPRVNVSWNDARITTHDQINVGIAMAIDAGLIVPVIHRADTLSIGEIAARRDELINRARSGKLKLDDIQGGTFTLSNLGMYGIDSFHAIVNPPQAAILAVGRLADRVVAVNGQPAVQPMMTLTLSFDHRAVDGARGAQFLGTLAEWIEEPLGLLK